MRKILIMFTLMFSLTFIKGLNIKAVDENPLVWDVFTVVGKTRISTAITIPEYAETISIYIPRSYQVVMTKEGINSTLTISDIDDNTLEVNNLTEYGFTDRNNSGYIFIDLTTFDDKVGEIAIGLMTKDNMLPSGFIPYMNENSFYKINEPSFKVEYYKFNTLETSYFYIDLPEPREPFSTPEGQTFVGWFTITGELYEFGYIKPEYVVNGVFKLYARFNDTGDVLIPDIPDSDTDNILVSILESFRMNTNAGRVLLFLVINVLIIVVMAKFSLGTGVTLMVMMAILALFMVLGALTMMTGIVVLGFEILGFIYYIKEG